MTRCLGCTRRIHAPSEESFLKQKLRHLRNCAALKLHGEALTFEQLPPKVIAKLTVLRPPRTVWQRLRILVHAILRAVWR